MYLYCHVKLCVYVYNISTGRGSDYYDPETYSVTILAGVTKASFDISIGNISESNEEFYLIINEDLLPIHVVGGSITRTKVIIEDANSK